MIADKGVLCDGQLRLRIGRHPGGQLQVHLVNPDHPGSQFRPQYVHRRIVQQARDERLRVVVGRARIGLARKQVLIDEWCQGGQAQPGRVNQDSLAR